MSQPETPVLDRSIRDNLRAVITDIEGTTTDIAFVRDVLFPYARARLAAFIDVQATDPVVLAALAETEAIAGRPLGVSGAISLLQQWLDEDRKLTPLKALQGLIWEAGYLDGSLRAPVYDDVSPALRRWRKRGLQLYVYSSGSIAAQQLLFRYSTDGDLTTVFEGYFDTTIGGKLESSSYHAIAVRLELLPGQLLFLSDNPGEVAAARQAGWHAVRVERGESLAGQEDRAVRSFAELLL
ncbi:acireductone synthase [Neisseriaceae bacterium JH1-16]|nr:acireductone synthase [Neisseriaceae bacterium JH1-16]